MKTIPSILAEAKAEPHCKVEPPSGMPSLPSPLVLPDDLAHFYSLCGGLDLFPCEDWGWRIVRPDEFIRTDLVVHTQSFYEEHRASFDGRRAASLYFIATRGCGPDFLSIDVSRRALGWCYDSYANDHGLDNNDIVALSFTELLNELFYWRTGIGRDHNKYYGKLCDTVPKLRRKQ